MRVHTIDLDFQGIPHAIAAYLVEGPSGPLLIETGPASTYPALKAALSAYGVAAADLAAVFVTHIQSASDALPNSNILRQYLIMINPHVYTVRRPSVFGDPYPILSWVRIRSLTQTSFDSA